MPEAEAPAPTVIAPPHPPALEAKPFALETEAATSVRGRPPQTSVLESASDCKVVSTILTLVLT
ncbi:hypothetical protein GCM10027269_43610 [Kribbella endophytica]